MSKSESKSRILYIYKMLMEQTDSEHYLTVQQMISQLEEKGISAFRKTVISDIEQLTEFGVDIVCVKSSQNRYHIEKREFMLPELKLLVDAVESSQFITKSKSAELIGKLSDLASTYQADELCREIYLAHRMKSDNEEIYDVVNSIHSAVRQQKQISFLYYEFDTEKKRVLRNDGERYQFSPYGMTWEDSRYYVIGYSEKHKKIVSFRADRMSSVEIMNYACVEKPDGFDMNEFVKRTFRMFDDKLETVTLKCRNEVMKSVIDRFGLDVQTEPYADGKYFKAVVEVGASQTFFGWVFQFGGDVHIVKPINVKKKFVEMATDLLLRLYRKVNWSISDKLDDLNEIAYESCLGDMESLSYLLNFAPERELDTFRSRAVNAMQSRVLIDLIEKAVVKIREYPDNGGIYYSIIDLKFLNYFKYSEEDILEELDLERSTYYRKKKEATLLLGYILFGLIMPEYIRNEKVANM